MDELLTLAGQNQWNPEAVMQWLPRYNVTAEMLIQRMANLFPKHFGISNIFFIRFYTGPEQHKFVMTKEMHLAQLHNPHANQLDEHYCRRWISINLMKRLRTEMSLNPDNNTLVDAQISRYWQTDKEYFVLSIARPSWDDANNSSSVTIGILLDQRTRSKFRFIADPSLPKMEVHTTCERCSIKDCKVRAVPPVFIQREQEKLKLQNFLKALKGKMVVKG